MDYSLVTSVVPAEEPITTAQAKVHLRVDVDTEDGLIASFIKAATRQAQNETGRRFVTQTLVYVTKQFPSSGQIELPVDPVQSVSSVKYYDANGVQQTLVADTNYLTWLAHSPPLVYPAPGTVWPGVQVGRLDVIEVTFVAGYGAASAVPDEAKAAIYLTVGYWFENRGDVADPTELGLPSGALRLLRSLSTGSYS